MSAKILAISYLFPNCVFPNDGIFVLNRLKALRKYVEIKVINPIPWSPVHTKIPRFRKYQEIPTVENIDGIEVFHPRFFSIPRYLKCVEALSYFLAVSRTVKEMKEQFEFELIDLQWTFPDLPTGFWLKKMYGKKLIVNIRGKEAFHWQDFGLRKHIVRRYLAKVDQVIALGDQLKKFSDEIIGDNRNSVVIRNGVDTDRFVYMAKARAREILDVSQDELFILAVGALVYGKGFDLIAKALQSITQIPRYRNLKVFVIGSSGAAGDDTKKIHRTIQSCKVEKHFIFKGNVPNEELKHWYNAADVFCLASRSEGSPNVLTEALACGCPAVATDVGAVRDILEAETEIGICVAPDDVESLRQGLLDALSTDFNRQQTAEKIKKYDWDWCARNVIMIYRNLLEKRPSID